MTVLTVEQLNPANGDVADGRRVRMCDGSVASIAQVADGLLLILTGAEFGPYSSPWRVLDELCRIETAMADRTGGSDKGRALEVQ